MANGSNNDLICLSTLELKVARLSKAGYHRSGIAAALGVSGNTVKTVLRRIHKKLGDGWKERPIRAAESHTSLEPVAVSFFEPHPAGEWGEIPNNRLVSLSLLVAGSRQGATVFRISGMQRFFLRPALAKLVENKHLRLLKVDWYDIYQPEWLPIVNRGRKTIRAAHYITTNGTYVERYLQNYLSHELPNYLEQLTASLEKAAVIESRSSLSIPLLAIQELKHLSAEAFGLKKYP